MLNFRLLKESLASRAYLIAAVLHTIFNSIFIIINAYLLALAVNGVFIKKEGLVQINTYILLFLLNAVIKAVFNFITERCIKNSSESIKEGIRKRVFLKIISSNPLKVMRQSQGELLSLLTEGVEMLTPYYSQYIPQMISSVVIPAAVLVSVVFVDKLSALILFLTYPIIPLFMILLGYKTKELNEKQWKKLSLLSSHFLDMLQGLRTLKVFGRSNIQENKVFEVSESYRKSTMEVLRTAFLSALVLETAGTVSTALVAVNLGLRLLYGKIMFFNAFFILVLAPDFYLPLRQLGLKFHSSINGEVAIEKIDSVESCLEADSQGEKLEDPEGPIEIKVKNLSFSHEKGEAISSASFRISPGEKVAILGESGSGKSTLLNILSGFYRVQRGMVFINGRDINDVNLKSYLKRIAMVPQFPHIFNASIEENILLGNGDIDNKEFEEICTLTGVMEFAKRLGEGYKTVIGEGEEVSISGGEKQRIAWARALAKKTDIIILDEPTSALDPETEEKVLKLIESNLKNKTVITAAHRLNTLKSADKILMLHGGRLIEEGTHSELMLQSGSYFELMRSAEDRV